MCKSITLINKCQGSKLQRQGPSGKNAEGDYAPMAPTPPVKS